MHNEDDLTHCVDSVPTSQRNKDPWMERQRAHERINKQKEDAFPVLKKAKEVKGHASSLFLDYHYAKENEQKGSPERKALNKARGDFQKLRDELAELIELIESAKY